MNDTPFSSSSLIFIHPDYDVWKHFPQGHSEMVGYWAEYQIFGDVILLDRGLSGTEERFLC